MKTLVYILNKLALCVVAAVMWYAYSCMPGLFECILEQIE